MLTRTRGVIGSGSRILSGSRCGVGALGGGVFDPSKIQVDGEYLAMLYAMSKVPYYHASGLSGVQYLDSKERHGSYRAPRQGRAYVFDGSNDYGTRAKVTSGAVTALTATAWVKTNNTATTKTVVSEWNGVNSTSVFSFAIAITTGFMRWVGYSAGGNTDVTASTAVHDGNWHHVACVYGASRIKIYVDGVEDLDQAAIAALSNGTAVFSVGVLGTTIARHTGSMRDVRIYSVAKDATAIANIYAGATDLTGLVAQYNCNEESGTVGYDASGNGNHLTLTNITEGTFHATDTAVTSNPANAVGYTLSGSVIVPRDESDPTLDVLGGALTHTGRCPYPVRVDTPCITGEATAYAELGSPLLPATADFELSFRYYHADTGTTAKAVFGQVTSTAGLIMLANNALADRLQLYGFAGGINIFTTWLTLNAWHKIVLTRVGTLFTFAAYSASGALIGSATANSSSSIEQLNTRVLGGNGYTSAIGSVADIQITTGGVTTYFPLQDGPGSSNTNRDLAYIKSDGTYGVVANAIVNGTVSTIWANRVPGQVKDWCVEYGGDIAANGAFLPGQISGNLSADGTAKTLSAGKYGNLFSRRNNNPFTAAEFNGRSIGTAIEVGDAAAGTPSDSSFHRVAADGDDRILVFSEALTGSNLSKVQDLTS